MSAQNAPTRVGTTRVSLRWTGRLVLAVVVMVVLGCQIVFGIRMIWRKLHAPQSATSVASLTAPWALQPQVKSVSASKLAGILYLISAMS